MNNTCCKLFVYGSLRQGFHSPAYHYISRYFDFKSMARVKGIMYDMGSYPAAVPSDGGTFITGELYELKKPAEFDWAIAQLDDYEGVNVEADEMQLYRRDLVKVYTDNGEELAWIYWYNRTIQNRPVVVSGDIMQYIAEKQQIP